MCPDVDKSGSNRMKGSSATSGPNINPLYEYLIDLQWKRIAVVEALAPKRHERWQLGTSVLLVLWWAADHIEALKGFPSALVILLGPVVIFGGLAIAGWKAQMIAVKALPSPFEYPKALELLLSTPLSGYEITSATVMAHIRYPFMGVTAKRVGLVLANLVIYTLIILESAGRQTVIADVLDMSLKFYLPALCVFIFFPVLTGVDTLMVPSGWLKKSMNSAIGDGNEYGRSGFLPLIAMTLALAPIIQKINMFDAGDRYNLMWIITVACPVILVTIPVCIIILILLLPGHLEKVRRSG